MAADFPLSLIIRAVDKVTAPLRAVNERIQKATEPVRKLNNSFRALGAEAGLFRVGDAVKSVTGKVLGLGLGFLGLQAISVGALYHMVRGSVEAGDALFMAARRVGLTVDRYAQLRFAAAQAGVEQEQFASSMDRFNRSLGLAKAGTGPLYEFLSKISPKLAEQFRNSKGTNEALAVMTRAFEKLQDPAKIAALSAAAFGKGSVEMGQFLHEGTAELEKQAKRFTELAGSKEKSAKAARELEDAFREMDVAMGGVRGALVVGLYPAVLAISQAFTKFLVEHRESIVGWAKKTGKAISDWVEGGGVQRLVATLEKLASAVAWVVNALGGVQNVAMIVAGAIGVKLAVSIGIAAKAIWGLGMAILGTPVGWFLAAIAAIGGAVYLIVKYWEPIKKFFKGLWDDVVGAFEWAWQKIKPIVDGVMKVIEPVTSLFSGERPTVGAGNPAVAGPRAGEAHVTVDFNNVPRGTRVTTAPQSTADVDLGLGYSMAVPQ